MGHSSWGGTLLLRWDIPPGEGLSSWGGTLLLGRDSPPGEGLSSWGGTFLFGRDFPLRERLSSSDGTFLLGGTLLLRRDFRLGRRGTQAVRWNCGGRGWLWCCRLVCELSAFWPWSFARCWLAWRAPWWRRALRWLELAPRTTGTGATSVATCGARPRCGGRCPCGRLCRARAPRRARSRPHRRRSWRQRQPRF